MAAPFIATSTAGWIDVFPNTPVRFEDLNIENILLVLEKTWINPDTQTNLEVFQVEVCEGGVSHLNLRRTTYLFPTNGATLDQFKAILDAQSAGNKVVKYTDLIAIGNIENTITSRPVLINEHKIIRKVYLPSEDVTAIYCDAFELQAKQLFVDGDQTTAVDYYYEYYGV